MARRGGFYVAIEYIYVATELAKTRRNYVATEQFYVAIELARVGRISVATKDFYVVTELAMTKNSTAHDRDGCAKVGAHDSVASCCVATEEAMCEPHSRPRAHDRPWARTTEVSARQGNYVVTDLDSDEKKKRKKKKTPGIWGITIVI